MRCFTTAKEKRAGMSKTEGPAHSASTGAQEKLSHTQWLAKVSAIQREKVGPEEWRELSAKAESMRVSMYACAKSRSAACKMQQVRFDVKTSIEAMTGLRESRGGVDEDESETTNQWMDISNKAETSIFEGCKATSDAEDVERYVQQRHQRHLGMQAPISSANDPFGPNIQAPQESEEDVSISFEEFRAIPATDAEEATKFKVYETFAAACEQIRGQLFAFYDENKSKLGPRVCAAMSRTLKDIDRAENLNIADTSDDSTWFVLLMAEKVNSNATMMTRILRDFERRLELLAAADQTCPICLEPFTTAAAADGAAAPADPSAPPAAAGLRTAEVLGCCHCVCAECWANVERLARGRPLCPLCRHEEFIQELSAAAAAVGAAPVGAAASD